MVALRNCGELCQGFGVEQKRREERCEGKKTESKEQAGIECNVIKGKGNGRKGTNDLEKYDRNNRGRWKCNVIKGNKMEGQKQKDLEKFDTREVV